MMDLLKRNRVAVLGLVAGALAVGAAAMAGPPNTAVEAAKLRSELKRAARQNKPLRITPRVGIGPIRFGMLAAGVKKAVGEPFRVSGKAYEYQRLGLAVMLDREDRVAAILAGAWCESSDVLLDVFKGATREGVKLRSTRQEVVAAYGNPDSTQTVGEKGQEFEVLKYAAFRTQFAFRGGKLVHITLKRPAAPTN